MQCPPLVIDGHYRPGDDHRSGTSFDAAADYAFPRLRGRDDDSLPRFHICFSPWRDNRIVSQLRRAWRQDTGVSHGISLTYESVGFDIDDTAAFHFPSRLPRRHCVSPIALRLEIALASSFSLIISFKYLQAADLCRADHYFTLRLILERLTAIIPSTMILFL